MTKESFDKGYELLEEIGGIEQSLENLSREGYGGVRIGKNLGMSVEVGLGAEDYQKVIDLCEYLLKRKLKSTKAEFEAL